MLLVLGWGNSLREDDGVAWRVCEELRRRLPSVRVLVLPQLVPELALEIAKSDGVVFVDARAGGTPGVVLRQPLPPTGGPMAGGHEIDPAVLVSLSEHLTGYRARAALVTVSVERLGFGECLSPAVDAAVPAAVRAVAEQLSAWDPTS